MRVRNQAEEDLQSKRVAIDQPLETISDDVMQRGLYSALLQWRDEIVQQQRTAGHLIISQKLIADLARLRPTAPNELLTIRGFGKAKTKQIGGQILLVTKAI